jgi:Flp pilus assembly protein TadG
MSSRARRRTLDGGSATVELVVLFPALLGLIFIVVQAGLHYYARSVALAAAQEGARAAAVQGGSAGTGQAAAQAFVARAGAELLGGSSTTATRSATEVTVTVTGRSMSLVPGYPGFPIRQQASAPVERVS